MVWQEKELLSRNRFLPGVAGISFFIGFCAVLLPMREKTRTMFSILLKKILSFKITSKTIFTFDSIYIWVLCHRKMILQKNSEWSNRDLIKKDFLFISIKWSVRIRKISDLLFKSWLARSLYNLNDEIFICSLTAAPSLSQKNFQIG